MSPKVGEVDGAHDDLGDMTGDRLRARVDKMLAAGRVTAEDAARVRAAADGDDLGAVVAEIRRRHAAEWLERMVKAGRIELREAEVMRRRLKRGEDPHSVLRSRGWRGQR
jgi:hypothetical protein